MENKIPIESRNKLNKTFARRIGKRLSDYNKDLLENTLPKYEFSNKLLLSSTKKKKIPRNWLWYGRTFI